MANISDQDLATLNQMTAQLSADKGNADQQATVVNTTQAALAAAQTNAQAASTAKAASDVTVSNDLLAIQTFLTSVINPTTPTPPPAMAKKPA